MFKLDKVDCGGGGGGGTEAPYIVEYGGAGC